MFSILLINVFSFGHFMDSVCIFSIWHLSEYECYSSDHNRKYQYFCWCGIKSDSVSFGFVDLCREFTSFFPCEDGQICTA